jgi:hypothetical protein
VLESMPVSAAGRGEAVTAEIAVDGSFLSSTKEPEPFATDVILTVLRGDSRKLFRYAPPVGE